MSEVEKNLDAILEVAEEVVVEAEVVGEIVVAEQHPVATITDDPQPNTNRDVEFDYEFSRTTHRDLIEQGQEALGDLLKVAKEGQHPRAYEVAANMLKSLSDMTDKLMVLHKQKKELDGREGGPAPTQQTVNIDKAVFTGSTADLLKQIKNG
jgi:hypothetical protein